jgi:hypothetical protein
MSRSLPGVMGVIQKYGTWHEEHIAGWWFFALPVWKIWKSVGMMTFPIYAKIIQMFQTTNQINHY